MKISRHDRVTISNRTSHLDHKGEQTARQIKKQGAPAPCLFVSAKAKPLTGRGDWIWTSGLLVPNQARYQTALHLDMELMGGFEPPTYSLRVNCSTSWATSAHQAYLFYKIIMRLSMMRRQFYQNILQERLCWKSRQINAKSALFREVCARGKIFAQFLRENALQSFLFLVYLIGNSEA